MSLFYGIDTPFFDNATGAPLAFGYVYFGLPNQDAITNPKTPYTDSTYATTLPATQELTIAGKFQQEIWLNGDYSIIITDANGVQQAEYLYVPEPAGGGGGGTVDSVVAGTGITVDSTDPANPIVTNNGVRSITAGSQVSVDSTNPNSPTVSSTFATSNTAASYTLSATNDNQWIDITGSGTVDITCPPESSVNLGAKFVHIISNYSSGTVTIVAGSGVTVRPPAGGTLVIPQYATVGIKKADNAADTYIVFGPTQAA